MNSELLRQISTEEIDIYHRHGVVPLRGMFDKDWIELLNKDLILIVNLQQNVRVYGIKMTQDIPCFMTL